MINLFSKLIGDCISNGDKITKEEYSKLPYIKSFNKKLECKVGQLFRVLSDELLESYEDVYLPVLRFTGDINNMVPETMVLSQDICDDETDEGWDEDYMGDICDDETDEGWED
jgi:hypothetical protein